MGTQLSNAHINESIKGILLKSKYYISCNTDFALHTSQIECLLDNTSYSINKTESGGLSNTFNDWFISDPNLLYPYLNLLINDIAKVKKYPKEWVLYYVSGSPIKSYRGLFEKKSLDLIDLVEDLAENGLSRDNVKLAKEYGCDKDFCTLYCMYLQLME